jgi:hypothetical protein
VRRVVRPLSAFAAAHLAHYALVLAAWLHLGSAVLAGSATAATVGRWAALMLAAHACRMAATRAQAALAVTVGTHLRRRLLPGAFRLDTGTVRRVGVGGFLGRTLELESLEDALTGPALAGLAAVFDLAIAGAVLAITLGAPGVALLLAWLSIGGLAAHRYAIRRLAWTGTRLAWGAELAEQIAGHRTRAVQARPGRDPVDDGTRCDRDGAAMDRCAIVLTVMVPRGWALTGVALLAIDGTAEAAFAVLVTTAALGRLTLGLTGLADARAAWAHVRQPPGDPAPPGNPASSGDRRVLTVPPADHNHLIAGSLALNLLLGRDWPPGPDDLRDADRICRSLGLGDVIDRMPAGLGQFVGETGWQLSAGERELVFLARALLQGADVLILGGTLDALDPQTRATALEAAHAAVAAKARRGG